MHRGAKFPHESIAHRVGCGAAFPFLREGSQRGASLLLRRTTAGESVSIINAARLEKQRAIVELHGEQIARRGALQRREAVADLRGAWRAAQRAVTEFRHALPADVSVVGRPQASRQRGLAAADDWHFFAATDIRPTCDRRTST